MASNKTHTIQNKNLMNSKLELYHYTDEESFHSIKREGVIRAGTMSKYGVGIYLTDLDPEEYNYGEGAQRNLERSRLDHHIPIHISSYEVLQTTANVYRYPHEMLRLDEYSAQNADSNQRWFQRPSQPFMVVRGEAMAVTIDRFFQDSDRLSNRLSNRRDRMYQRRIYLEQRLDPIITKHSESVPVCLMEYATNRIDSDGVCITCLRCQARVTKVYQGGALWASRVDHREVLTRLFEHDEMHLKKLVARILGAAIAFWMYQYGWRTSFYSGCSFPVALGTTICAGVTCMWIASNKSILT
jgi:HYD1 signature containing ADP-ribosyltransferase